METELKGRRIWKEISCGASFRIKACRVDIGVYNLILVEFYHPDYNYSWGHSIWFRTPFGKWVGISIRNESEKRNVEEFIDEYPNFEDLFVTEEK